MVFTQYTDTMDFLRGELSATPDLPVMCFSGRGGEVRGADGGWRDGLARRRSSGASARARPTSCSAPTPRPRVSISSSAARWSTTTCRGTRCGSSSGSAASTGSGRSTDIRIVNLHYEGHGRDRRLPCARAQRIDLFTDRRRQAAADPGRLPRDIAERLVHRSSRPARTRSSRAREPHPERRVVGRSGRFDLDSITQADLDEPARPEALYYLPALTAWLTAPASCLLASR